MSGSTTTLQLAMSAAHIALAAILAMTPGLAAADSHGQGVSQYRNGPFSEFDLKAIGIALVVAMIVLGIRAVRRRRS
jgi:hypothetical protein